MSRVRIKSAFMRTHLGTDILKGRGGDDREAEEEDIGLGVTERSESTVMLETFELSLLAHSFWENVLQSKVPAGGPCANSRSTHS
jgi:hypothetical protein